jgi:hypothetical protein
MKFSQAVWMKNLLNSPTFYRRFPRLQERLSPINSSTAGASPGGSRRAPGGWRFRANGAVKGGLALADGKLYFGDYGGAWDRLHPRHQRFVTRQEYEECRRGIDVRGTIDSLVVLDVRDAPLTVYGLPARTPAKRVQVRVVTDETEYTASYHVVRVADEWRWVLTDRAARGFERTDCPE